MRCKVNLQWPGAVTWIPECNILVHWIALLAPFSNVYRPWPCKVPTFRLVSAQGGEGGLLAEGRLDPCLQWMVVQKVCVGLEWKPWVRSNMWLLRNMPTLKPVLFWCQYLLWLMLKLYGKVLPTSQYSCFCWGELWWRVYTRIDV